MGIFDFLKKPADKANESGEVLHNPTLQTEGEISYGQAIGTKEVQKATQILMDFKRGKDNLEKRLIENEEWYRQRHWDYLKGDKKGLKPRSAWLFNAIANKHADAMDNIPTCNALPREEDDKAEAEKLSSVIPVILDHTDFEEIYSEIAMDKIKSGTGIYGVFWDPKAHGGLGDISIKAIDLLNIFFEPGITDIQRSKCVFHTELCDNDSLRTQYPQLKNKLGGKSFNVAQYVYDDTVDTSNSSVVIDVYYKKQTGNRTVLHFIKYVNDIVLYATENDPQYAEVGLYDHGLYPFVFDTLYSIKGNPAGFGLIDVAKNTQEYIDRIKGATLENALTNASPRFFVREDGAINVEEFADLENKLIRCAGSSLGEDSVRAVSSTGLSGIYVDVLHSEIEELKETTGNRDVSTGGTTGGVTSASGIASLQEASSKLSRDSNQASYRAFKKVCLIVIELIRQFYDVSRTFRIVGERGAAKYVQMNNARLKGVQQSDEFGMDMGIRKPQFDLEIVAQKKSPYTKLAQNELAIQLYQLGFFNPQMSDQALATLDMMDFDRKSFVMEKVAQNGTMFQQIQALQQQILMLTQTIDSLSGGNLTAQVAGETMGQKAAVNPSGEVSAHPLEDSGETPGEHAFAKESRKRVAESASPR